MSATWPAELIKSLYPDVKVVLLCTSLNLKSLTISFDYGISGYILKSDYSDELHFALKQVVRGKRYISSDLLVELVNANACVLKLGDQEIDLSEREWEILELIAQGMTNNEISDKLFISKRTVEGHRQKLLEKTNSRNTAMLIRYAIKNRLLV